MTGPENKTRKRIQRLLDNFNASFFSSMYFKETIIVGYLTDVSLSFIRWHTKRKKGKFYKSIDGWNESRHLFIFAGCPLRKRMFGG